MKNQYVADINDFRKYGLIRILSDGGKKRTGVCWMLTDDDGRGDGGRTHYISKPQDFRCFNPPLFDLLRDCLKEPKNRNVGWLERQDVLPGAIYYSRTLTDSRTERAGYFQDFLAFVRQRKCDMVFFDPDNGLEVKSKPLGRKGSCKYLYREELRKTFDMGFSVLLYQHFPRKKRDEFIASIAEELCVLTQASSVFPFRTSNVVFMLLPQQGHLEYFRERAEQAARVWKPQILTLDSVPHAPSSDKLPCGGRG